MLSMKAKILIIEDDPRIQDLVGATLSLNDYSYQFASSAREGIQLFHANNPDVVLLDLGLPDKDGVEVVHKIREESNAPIIVVSARSEMMDKIAALDAGADDYLTKPFDPDELLARIRVAIRRLQSVDGSQDIVTNGLLKMDVSQGTVMVDNHELHVTPTEYKLLLLMLQNVGKVLTYNTILKEVWGLYSDNIPALRVFVTTLRKKIEKYDPNNNYLQTHVGVGYRMIKIEN